MRSKKIINKIKKIRQKAAKKSMELIIVACTLAMIISCGKPKEEIVEVEEPSPITWESCSHNIGDHPCDFTLADQNGDDWNLYENYGNIIILDFSTEWCGYCQVAASEAQALQDEYEDQGVIYVTILIENSSGNPANQELVTGWADYFNIDAPVLAGSRDMLNSTTAGGWIIEGGPSFYIINKYSNNLILYILHHLFITLS